MGDKCGVGSEQVGASSRDNAAMVPPTNDQDEGTVRTSKTDGRSGKRNRSENDVSDKERRTKAPPASTRYRMGNGGSGDDAEETSVISASSVSSETQPTDSSVALPQPDGERGRHTVSGLTARLNSGEITDEEYICTLRELATKRAMDYSAKVAVLGRSLNKENREGLANAIVGLTEVIDALASHNDRLIREREELRRAGGVKSSRQRVAKPAPRPTPTGEPLAITASGETADVRVETGGETGGAAQERSEGGASGFQLVEGRRRRGRRGKKPAGSSEVPVVASGQASVTAGNAGKRTYAGAVAAVPKPRDRTTKSATLVADRVARVRDRGDRKLVLVTAIEPEKIKSVKTVLERAIDPRKEGLRVSNVFSTRRGVLVELGDDASRDKLLAATAKLAQAGLVAQRPRDRMPRIKIFDVRSDLSENDVVDFVFDQNLKSHVDFRGVEKLDQNLFKLLHKEGGAERRKTVDWVAVVSPKVRAALLGMRRVSIGWHDCRVVDYVRVSQCARCLRFGHVVKSCPRTATTCRHCGKEGHALNECTERSKPPVCVLCSTARRDSNHRVASKNCPAVEIAKQREVERTLYVERDGDATSRDE